MKPSPRVSAGVAVADRQEGTVALGQARPALALRGADRRPAHALMPPARSGRGSRRGPGQPARRAAPSRDCGGGDEAVAGRRLEVELVADQLVGQDRLEEPAPGEPGVGRRGIDGAAPEAGARPAQVLPLAPGDRDQVAQDGTARGTAAGPGSAEVEVAGERRIELDPVERASSSVRSRNRPEPPRAGRSRRSAAAVVHCPAGVDEQLEPETVDRGSGDLLGRDPGDARPAEAVGRRRPALDRSPARARRRRRAGRGSRACSGRRHLRRRRPGRPRHSPARWASPRTAS